ncbi:RNA-binding protein [Candidatus Woesearchaeota archaeon]|nr:RNA-binding protein [Candidatus Woesearchaeota archaeon]
MSKKQLRKDEVEALDRIVHDKYKLENFFRKKRVEIADDHYVYVDGIVAFLKQDDLWIPCLKLLQQHNFLKTVTVDSGAVQFVCSGADVMRPGITAFDTDIQKDEIVAIVDQTHKKPIAVGRMLVSGTEATALAKGKIIRNLHFVGDDAWTA